MIGTDYIDKTGWIMTHVGHDGNMWVMRAVSGCGCVGTVLMHPASLTTLTRACSPRRVRMMAIFHSSGGGADA